ncbi:MAG: thioesterase family protein [Gammaproteobacteria bacterium]
MHSEVFSYPFLIKEHHLDTFGHVNNAAYLSILEEARWDLITARGFGMKTIKETGLGPTILEIKISFIKELKLRDEIDIQTQMLSYDGKVGTLVQKMIRKDEVCCSAEFLIGLFSLKERRLIEPTAEWRRALGME